MLVLVVVLVVTNLATLGALLYLRLRPHEHAIERTVDEALRTAGGQQQPRTRQLISIEILNPIELAGARGRVLGIAGSFAPGFTRRLVYDQTAKILRTELAARSVVADVHVHTLRPLPTGEIAEYTDEVDQAVGSPGDQPPV